jgi:hypothetical protein
VQSPKEIYAINGCPGSIQENAQTVLSGVRHRARNQPNNIGFCVELLALEIEPGMLENLDALVIRPRHRERTFHLECCTALPPASVGAYKENILGCPAQMARLQVYFLQLASKQEWRGSSEQEKREKRSIDMLLEV